MALQITPGSLSAAHEEIQVRTATVPQGGDLSHLLCGVLVLHNPTQEALRCALPPSGGVTLLFPTDDSAVLCGPLSCSHLLTLQGGETIYGARLHWDCGDWLWNGSLLQLVDHTVPLEPLLPGSDRLGSALHRCTSPQEETALLSRILTLRGARQYRSAPLLRRIIELLAEKGGQLQVSELAALLGCNERYLNRILRQKVGLSTKPLCQLLQMQLTAELLMRECPKSLLHAAVACGYFDQAHMNRRCRSLLLDNASTVRALGERRHSAQLLALLALR